MYKNLLSKSKWLRKSLFDMAMSQKSGHIPSCFSMVEVMISLYYGGVAKVFKGNPNSPDRDYIFVSKGHASMTQYPILSGYKAILTLEEQMLDGGFGGAILEMLADQEVFIPVKRIGIKDKFEVVNGKRKHLNKLYSIDVDSTALAVKTLIDGLA